MIKSETISPALLSKLNLEVNQPILNSTWNISDNNAYGVKWKIKQQVWIEDYWFLYVAHNAEITSLLSS